MPKIKSKNYLKFIEKGQIDLFNEDELLKSLDRFNGKHKLEFMALCGLLYYSGCRPNEALSMKSEDITRERGYVIAQVPASKNGLPRPVYLPIKFKLVKLIYKWSLKLPPQMYLFYNFRSEYVREYTDKKGNIRQYIERTDKFRYHFYKCFGSIPPYYFRHNRFSKLISKGATTEDIMQIKGAKTPMSVRPYMHLSAEKSKRLARKMD